MSLAKPGGNLGGRNRFGAMTTKRTYNGLWLKTRLKFNIMTMSDVNSQDTVDGLEDLGGIPQRVLAVLRNEHTSSNLTLWMNTDDKYMSQWRRDTKSFTWIKYNSRAQFIVDDIYYISKINEMTFFVTMTLDNYIKFCHNDTQENNIIMKYFSRIDLVQFNLQQNTIRKTYDDILYRKLKRLLLTIRMIHNNDSNILHTNLLTKYTSQR